MKVKFVVGCRVGLCFMIRKYLNVDEQSYLKVFGDNLSIQWRLGDYFQGEIYLIYRRG